MTNLNSDIRICAFQNNIKMYQIADKLGIHYVTLNSKLRKKLSTEERRNIFNIIEELKAISKEKEMRLKTDDITGETSLGTTPRQKTDLFASWADLTTGSGDEQTPVVYSVGFLK